MIRSALRIALCPCLLAAILAATGPAIAQTETPRPLVDSYESLADSILALKKTEWNLVHSILATTYQHAEATLASATMKIQDGKDASQDIEQLAELVAHLGNEGDSSVAAIRKRLLEGGHHHNAAGESAGVYDEGFVIVTREAKKVFLDAAARIGKLAMSPDAKALNAEWKKIAKQFASLHEGS